MVNTTYDCRFDPFSVISTVSFDFGIHSYLGAVSRKATLHTLANHYTVIINCQSY